MLYEGYLLYPYRATSGKNQLRWQFGVLGPPGAEQAGLGEGSSLSMQCLVRCLSTSSDDVGDGNHDHRPLPAGAAAAYPGA